MEPMLREIVEKIIDEVIAPENMTSTISFVEKLRPFVTSADEAAFGYALGSINAHIVNQCLLRLNRRPTEAELKEAVDVILGRAPEIKRACMI